MKPDTSLLKEEWKIKGKLASQRATILFENHIFKKVDYQISGIPYSESDWEFMGKINDTIKKIKNEKV